MAAEGEPPSYIVAAFDPDRHDRTAFSCGVARIDNFLKLTAKKQQRGDFTRVHVAVRLGEKSVVGFFALNAHAIDDEDAPDKLTRHAPRQGVIPVAYLSMIGVDRSAQGKRLGRALMIEAFNIVSSASDLIGFKCLMLDVLDDGDEALTARREAFYSGMGFISMPSKPTRMFITLPTIRTALAGS